MQQEIVRLHDKNLRLQKDITELMQEKTVIHSNVKHLTDENSALNEKVAEMSVTIDHLQNSEQEIKDLVEKLTTKIETGADPELKDQIEKLEQLYGTTHAEIKTLMERLNTLESGLKQAPISGIFTYIDKEKDQTLFIEKVQESLNQEMTYAQIDEYLTNTLPSELDKIIKEHPALTKNYIRNLRRD